MGSDFTPVDLVEHPILANKHLLSPTRRMVEVGRRMIANKTCCQFCDGMHAVGKHKHSIKTIWHGSYGDIRRVFQNPYRLHEANGTHKTIDNTTPALILFFILTASIVTSKKG